MSPVGYPEDESSYSSALRALKEYPNIHLRNLYIPKLVTGTPIEKWFMDGTLFKKTIFLRTHLSDFLRFLLVYSFGGTYMDMDLISLRSLDSLDRNYFAKEDPEITGSAVVDFTHDGIGHEIATAILL